MRRSLLRLRRHELPIALMYLDVDHFKRINDSFGHAARDAVLCTFARRLLDCTRASDLVARLGGDEFVVLIEDAALPGAVEAIARKLIDTMCVQIAVEDSTLQVTTSIGIAFASQAAEAATLMAAADARAVRGEEGRSQHLPYPKRGRRTKRRRQGLRSRIGVTVSQRSARRHQHGGETLLSQKTPADRRRQSAALE